MALSYDQLWQSAQMHAEHWRQADIARGTPIELPGGMGINEMRAEIALLETLHRSVTYTTNELELATGDVTAKKKAIMLLVFRFRNVVNVMVGVPHYTERLPVTPRIGMGRMAFLGPVFAVRDLWAELNGDASVPDFTPPLVLPSNFGLAQFLMEVAALDAAFVRLERAKGARAEAVRKRQAQAKRVTTLLVRYRSLVAALFPKGTAFIDALPRLYPKGKPRKKPETKAEPEEKAADEALPEEIPNPSMDEQNAPTP